jgi:hypothetical protein
MGPLTSRRRTLAHLSQIKALSRRFHLPAGAFFPEIEPKRAAV